MVKILEDIEKQQITTLTQFKARLKEYAEHFIHKKLKWSTVEEWITDALQEHVVDIAMGALGYEPDHFSKHWELSHSHSREEAPIQKTIANIAEMAIEEHLRPWMDEQRDKLRATLTSKKALASLREYYKEIFSNRMHDLMSKWAEEAASVDAELYFKEHTKEYFDSIRLSKPVTLNDIEHIAVTGDQEEEEEES